MPIIPALRRLRQEDHEFGARWGYMVKSCLKNKATILASYIANVGYRQRFQEIVT
jgi:hypothetical protein